MFALDHIIGKRHWRTLCDEEGSASEQVEIENAGTNP